MSLVTAVDRFQHVEFASVNLPGFRNRIVPLSELPSLVRTYGDSLRLLRLPNTRHSGCGLWKVPLLLRELFTCKPAELRATATGPRRPNAGDATGLLPLYQVAPVTATRDVYAECQEAVVGEGQRALPGVSPFPRTDETTPQVKQ